MLLDEQQQRPGELLGQIAMSMGLITDEQLAQALAEQMGMQVVSLSDVVDPARGARPHHRADGPALPHRARSSFKDNTLTIAMCDPQKLSILDELRSFLGYDIRAVVATEKDVLKALERYYAGRRRERRDAHRRHGARRRAGRRRRGPASSEGTLDLTSVEALADSAPVRKLLEHGAPAGDQGPRQRLALRAVRERVQDPHPRRRRALRDGAAAAAPGLRHHHAHQGHGRTSTSPSGGCRRTAASGSPSAATRSTSA